MKQLNNLTFVLAALAGAVAVVALTLLIYGTFFQNFLEQFNELDPDLMTLISRDSPTFIWIIVANLAQGFLIARYFNGASSTHPCAEQAPLRSSLS